MDVMGYEPLFHWSICVYGTPWFESPSDLPSTGLAVMFMFEVCICEANDWWLSGLVMTPGGAVKGDTGESELPDSAPFEEPGVIPIDLDLTGLLYVQGPFRCRHLSDHQSRRHIQRIALTTRLGRVAADFMMVALIASLFLESILIASRRHAASMPIHR
jgi:hypothetical protein